MKDWIALNMTPGVGSRVTARLLEHFGSAEAIFDAPRRELALLRLPLETVESIVSRELHARAETEIESVRNLGGDILVLDDGVYPALLRETYDPPVVLYVKGAWAECLELSVRGNRRLPPLFDLRPERSADVIARVGSARHHDHFRTGARH